MGAINKRVDNYVGYLYLEEEELESWYPSLSTDMWGTLNMQLTYEGCYVFSAPISMRLGDISLHKIAIITICYIGSTAETQG